MKKALVTIAAAVLIALTVPATPAYAWSWDLQVDTECVNYQTVATFTLDNTGENEVATVRSSSHTDLVPVGATVPKKGKLVKTVTITDDYTLSLGINWPSDSKIRVESATAKPKNNCERKVTLCHATSSQSNPYVSITVAYPSVQFNGHNGHNGHEDDIIPAFPGYPGKNLNKASLLQTDCNVPVTTTTTVPPTTTTLPPVTTTTTIPPTTTTVPPTTATTVVPPTTTTTIVEPPTTTIPPETTTTTVPPTTTTTVPVTVPPTTEPPRTTTTLPPVVTTTTEPPVVTTTVSPTTTTVVQPPTPELPHTGTDVEALMGLGFGLLIIGSLFLGVRRFK